MSVKKFQDSVIKYDMELEVQVWQEIREKFGPGFDINMPEIQELMEIRQAEWAASGYERELEKAETIIRRLLTKHGETDLLATRIAEHQSFPGEPGFEEKEQGLVRCLIELGLRRKQGDVPEEVSEAIDLDYRVRSLLVEGGLLSRAKSDDERQQLQELIYTAIQLGRSITKLELNEAHGSLIDGRLSGLNALQDYVDNNPKAISDDERAAIVQLDEQLQKTIPKPWPRYREIARQAGNWPLYQEIARRVMDAARSKGKEEHWQLTVWRVSTIIEGPRRTSKKVAHDRVRANITPRRHK